MKKKSVLYQHLILTMNTVLDQNGFYYPNEISFDGNSPPVNIDLERCFWKANDTKKVSFFEFAKPFHVKCINTTNGRIKKLLESLVDNYPIAMDIEWRRDDASYKNHPIAVFSFASSKGCIVVHNKALMPSQEVNDFLLRYEFIGHDLKTKREKLNDMFGYSYRIKEFTESYKVPAGLPSNFNEMVEFLYGKPKVEVVDSSTLGSDWQTPELTVKQVLYMAYKVIGLYRCYTSPKVSELPKATINLDNKKRGWVLRASSQQARQKAGRLRYASDGHSGDDRHPATQTRTKNLEMFKPSIAMQVPNNSNLSETRKSSGISYYNQIVAPYRASTVVEPPSWELSSGFRGSKYTNSYASKSIPREVASRQTPAQERQYLYDRFMFTNGPWQIYRETMTPKGCGDRENRAQEYARMSYAAGYDAGYHQAQKDQDTIQVIRERENPQTSKASSTTTTNANEEFVSPYMKSQSLSREKLAKSNFSYHDKKNATLHQGELDAILKSSSAGLLRN